MIRRPLVVALAFAASALALCGGLARVTAMTLALERAERAALERATHEENVRVALWRLDAILAELIALESTRPAARFRSPSETAGLAAMVTTRFEIGADRALRATPPVVPQPLWVAELPVPEQPPAAPPPPAPRGPVRPEEVTPVRQQASAAGDGAALDEARRMLEQQKNIATDRMNVGGNELGQQSAYTQEALNTQSFMRRQELGKQAQVVPPPRAAEGMEVESAFEPRWLGDDLVLVRRVRRGDERLLQGTWLDWPALRGVLLDQVAAVVPGARLEPIVRPAAEAADPGRRLALLPARLLPGPMPETEPRDWTPVRLSIAAAWVAALLGLAGVGSLLKGSVALSQRRADFVSAVTHELRTPLTTFRLYTDLLSGGMVSAREQSDYLATLKAEADRLGHLVDNVLAFSRLERRPAAARLESATLGEVLARTVPRLAERAGQAGLKLAVEAPAEHAAVRVRLDPASAEQVLLNLVDNACKYAPNASRPALHLETALRRRHAVLRLRDHGPGVEGRERRRIFLPFHRPAAQAAGGPPGVGLGLALGRRLARAMGGDLRLAAADEGASFELLLRRA